MPAATARRASTPGSRSDLIAWSGVLGWGAALATRASGAGTIGGRSGRRLYPNSSLWPSRRSGVYEERSGSASSRGPCFHSFERRHRTRQRADVEERHGAPPVRRDSRNWAPVRRVFPGSADAILRRSSHLLPTAELLGPSRP